MVCWKILFSSSRFSLAFLSVDRSHLVKRLLEDRLRRALVRDGLLEDFVLLLTVLARLLKLNLRLRDLLFERLLLLSLRLDFRGEVVDLYLHVFLMLSLLGGLLVVGVEVRDAAIFLHHLVLLLHTVLPRHISAFCK